MTSVQMVQVEWVDACTSDPWYDRDEMQEWAAKTPWRVFSLGWLVDEREDSITLAAARTADGEHFFQLIKIPRPAITAILVLREINGIPTAWLDADSSAP